MDSNIKVKTLGFEADKEFLRSLAERLEKVHDICPYNAALTVTIAKKAVQFEFLITLNFVNGRMEAEAFGRELEKTATKALDKIYDRICQWHTERFEDNDRTSPQATPDGYAPRVLIVDDDPLSTQFLDYCLKKSGCRTHLVDNGFAAVEEIASHQYDLVFLDWKMPQMSGAETLLSAQNMISYDRELERRFRQRRLPVITYSGEERTQIQLPECQHFRFVDHWDKSTPFHQLLSQASDVLFRFRTEEKTTEKSQH